MLDTHRPALLAEGLYHADGQILDEVFVYGSFRQSKMHAAGVSCRDCHDPHSLGLHGSIDTVCARCHLPEKFDSREHHLHAADSPGARCVVCHMPQRPYMGADLRGDHSFRIPRPDLSVKLGTPNPCTGCHVDRTDAWAAAVLAEQHGPRTDQHYAETLHAARRGDPGAAALLTALVDDTSQPAIVRATGLQMLGRRASRSTVGRALADDDPLVRLAALGVVETFEPSMRPPAALPLLEDPVRMVRGEAAKVLAPFRGLPDVAPRRQRLDVVLEEYQDIQRLNADRAESHLNSGLLQLGLGEPELAEQAYRKAIAIDPGFLPAYVNLADLERQRGREQQGEAALRQALAIDPENSEVHHALGLTLVRRKQPQAALELFARAWELRPEESRYGYVYGVALHSTGSSERALTVLGQTHERHPANRELLLALVTIARDVGRIETAIVHAERLARLDPADAQARALLDQLRAVPP